MMDDGWHGLEWVRIGSLPLLAEGGIDSISVLRHFVQQGGWITTFILIPLSVITLSMVIHYVLTIRRARHLPSDLAKALSAAARQGQVKNIMAVTRQNDTLLGAAIFAGLSQLRAGREAARAAVDEVVEERATRLYRRIEYLYVIGNISPMIGLLGTVYGMIYAFSRIFAAGGGMPDAGKLAGDISVALVTTFWGLVIAIPALTAHSLFRNRIDGYVAECVKTCDDLIVLASASAPTQTTPRPVGTPATAVSPPPPTPPLSSDSARRVVESK